MFIAESVNEQKTEQVRYQCPVCGHQHLLTQLRVISNRSMQSTAFITDLSLNKVLPLVLQ